MVHVFVEKQLPHWVRHGEIVQQSEDDDSVIRPDMGATCERCGDYDVSFDDWRAAPEDES